MKEAEIVNGTTADTQNTSENMKKNIQGDVQAAHSQERFGGLTRNETGSQGAEQDMASDETKSDFSICCDSPYYSLFGGIVGILEGFGLLNEETGNNVTPDDLIDTIAQAFQNAQNAVIMDGTALVAGEESKFSEMVARMPQIDQKNTIQSVQGEIENLVEEYLCSFANVNKKGTEEENLTGQKLEFTTGQDALKASVNTSRLKMQFMLKNAQHLKLFLSLKDSGAEPNEKAQKVMDNLLLMVKEVSKDISKKVMKVNTDSQNQTAKSDASFKDRTILATGADNKNVQNTDEAEFSLTEKEIPAAKTVQDNMERIIQKMSVSFKEGKQQFEVALKPEYLGKLSIKLMMDNDGIKAHIKAADTSLKGMITDQLPALQEALKERGLTVTQIEVSYERPAFENQQSHHQHWQNNNNQKSARYAIPDLGGITYEMMSDVPELLAYYSSVEFQA